MSRPDIPYLREATYVASYPTVKDCPDNGIPVTAVTGRSNSGKSSLISALCDIKNLARSSSEPGKTRALNYFRIPDRVAPPRGLYLVDLPGYGFAKLGHAERDRLRRMIDQFLLEGPGLALTIVALDARRDLGDEERSILDFCNEHDRPLILARTKWDKLNARERSAALAAWRKDDVTDVSIAVSSINGVGLVELLNRIRQATTG